MGEVSTVISLDKVHKTYTMGDEKVHALAGVSLRFAKGSFHAIMGASGSGKSTLLNLLGCLDRPTDGQYLFEGQDVITLSDDKLSDLRLTYIGFIFQSFNLIPQLTVRENIGLPLFYRKWTTEKREERAEELAAEVGLADRMNHRPSELSGGQQQRVAIARALANDPSIILADEPTGNLDSKTGNQIMEIMSELNTSGKTLIMVTHEPYIAEFASTQVHMRDGLVDRIETKN
ncbi:MAG: ABC transporter ATP-binding protein [Candidatus Hydrogenedentota bacterium]